MLGRRTKALGLLAALSAALSCCARPAPRVDVEAARREGRVIDKPPRAVREPVIGKMIDAPPLRWSGTTAVLERRGTFFHSGVRLTVEGRDARGGSTEFIVDTGASGATVGADAPAAATARIWPRPGTAIVDGDPAWNALLPELTIGGLRATDVPLAVWERSSTRGAPTNLIGMSLLTSLALSHEVAPDRWRLDQGGVQITSDPAARLEAPGLPVVTLVNEKGERVFALIDTGTPKSLHERGTPAGRYRLLDASGSVALVIDAATEAPWQNLNLAGRPLRIWIGLDALEKKPWTIDFATGVWSFGDQIERRRESGR